MDASLSTRAGDRGPAPHSLGIPFFPPSTRLPPAGLDMVAVLTQRAQKFIGVRIGDPRRDQLFTATRVVVRDSGHVSAQFTQRVLGKVGKTSSPPG